MKLKKYIISFALILFLSNVYAEFPAQTFNERIQKLNLKVPVKYNSEIDQYLDPWLGNSFNKTSVLLGKGDHYLPYIQKALKAANMPLELQYIPAALSAFGPQRVSEDGGTGIWQMTYRKARQYDLHISSYVDERRDYKKATDAAIKYLADLHKMLGRWDLAIAAFYADPIEVNKAIRMAGKGDNVSYWTIHEHLQARHQMAFPAYCASVYIFNYYKEHRIVKKTYSQVDTAQVKIMDWITFSKLSEALELKESEIEELNPTFKRAMIPHSDRTYYAIIPKNKKARFEMLGDSVYRFAEVI